MEVLQASKPGFEILFFFDHIPTNFEVSNSYLGRVSLRFDQTHVRPVATKVIFLALS